MSEELRDLFESQGIYNIKNYNIIVEYNFIYI